MQQNARIVALGSVAFAPLSEETRTRLLDAGVPPAELECQTELWGQSVLALHHREEFDQPQCYGQLFNPAADLCSGCVFMPTCWSEDRAYLQRLKAGDARAPAGVPQHVVAAKLAGVQPSGRRKAPPPKKVKQPPPKKR